MLVGSRHVSQWLQTLPPVLLLTFVLKGRRTVHHPARGAGDELGRHVTCDCDSGDQCAPAHRTNSVAPVTSTTASPSTKTWTAASRASSRHDGVGIALHTTEWSLTLQAPIAASPLAEQTALVVQSWLLLAPDLGDARGDGSDERLPR